MLWVFIFSKQNGSVVTCLLQSLLNDVIKKKEYQPKGVKTKGKYDVFRCCQSSDFRQVIR